MNITILADRYEDGSGDPSVEQVAAALREGGHKPSTPLVPDDIKQLAEPVLAHRLILDPEAEFDGVTPGSVVSQILMETPPPSDRQAV